MQKPKPAAPVRPWQVFKVYFGFFKSSISDRRNSMGLFSKKGFFLMGCKRSFLIQLYKVWLLMPNSFFTSLVDNISSSSGIHNFLSKTIHYVDIIHD
jgi:hypothetical protein